jgi:hypothetical protein
MGPYQFGSDNKATYLQLPLPTTVKPTIMHLSQLAFVGVTVFSASAHAEHLRAVFSSGGFSSISGPVGGSVSSNYNGFAILNNAGEAIYSQQHPDDHSPCYSNGGCEFTIEGNCRARARKFHCLCDLGENVKNCAVKGHDDYEFGSSEGRTDTTFIGIAIAQDSTCVVEFESEPAEGLAIAL